MRMQTVTDTNSEHLSLHSPRLSEVPAGMNANEWNLHLLALKEMSQDQKGSLSSKY